MHKDVYPVDSYVACDEMTQSNRGPEKLGGAPTATEEKLMVSPVQTCFIA